MKEKLTPFVTNYESIFAERLTQIMGETKTTQEMIAAAIGITRQAISKYTRGETKPDTEILTRIAKYFNVSADWLLGLSDVRRINPEIASVCAYTGLSENAVSQLIGPTTSEVMNLLLENEYMITQELLKTAGNISAVDGSFIGFIYRYLTLDIPKTLAYVNDSGEVMAVDGASSPLDWVGKGELIEMDRVAERIALDDVMRSVELLKAAYQQRKDAE